MSKQDIKEEMKDLEGNPQMKARIRRLQRDRLRRQMMREVPKATAVVVKETVGSPYAYVRMQALWALLGMGALTLLMQVDRSEERRVGKECRSRWSPYH